MKSDDHNWIESNKNHKKWRYISRGQLAVSDVTGGECDVMKENGNPPIRSYKLWRHKGDIVNCVLKRIVAKGTRGMWRYLWRMNRWRNT